MQRKIDPQMLELLKLGEFSTALERVRKSMIRPFVQSPHKSCNISSGGRWTAAAVETALLIENDLARYSTLEAVRQSTDSNSLRSPSQNQNKNNRGFGGGGDKPDFDSLIELITNTVQPKNWVAGGGEGDIQPYEGGGVYYDPGWCIEGKREQPIAVLACRLARKRQSRSKNAKASVRAFAPMRKISLVRLGSCRATQLALRGESPSEEMRVLAGLEQIQYLFVYPDQQDIVIAGPAGGWKTDDEGRFVSVRNQSPVLQLDDLIVVLRHMMSSKHTTFGCSISTGQGTIGCHTRLSIRGSTKGSSQARCDARE